VVTARRRRRKKRLASPAIVAKVSDQDVRLQRAREKNGQMKTTYLVACRGRRFARRRRHKIALCAPQATQKKTRFTCDHDKVPDEFGCELQMAREKYGQMKITYLVEGVVLHAAGGKKMHYHL
jgi:hypothetical protein